jgi:uncharacterized protein (TIGR04255 family)
MHEAHAIERVRVMFHFKDPLPSKILTKVTLGIVDAAPKLGFNSVTPAESGIATINIQPGGMPKQEPSKNGIVLRRHSDGNVAEEVGFRDLVFNYFTTTYGRWENLRQRLEEVVLPVLRNAEAAIELASIKLEYWDGFRFEGQPGEADVAGLLVDFDVALPPEVLAGKTAWHSHIGWFEGGEASPVLINRNFDMVDRTHADKTFRFLGVYTLVERRPGKEPLEISTVSETLEVMHKRVVRLFGETLTKEYRDMIGLDLSAYQ